VVAVGCSPVTPPSRTALVGPIAVREFATPVTSKKQAARREREERPPRPPAAVLFFDTETTADHVQRLTFGSYRYCRIVDGALVVTEEGLFHADDLAKTDPTGLATLHAYDRHERATRPAHDRMAFKCYTRREFVERVFYPAACSMDAIVVGFNLPFDLARLAVECRAAKGWFYGGFSFILAGYRDEHSHEWLDKLFAHVAVKRIDSKRAFFGFTGGSEPRTGHKAEARFLDLHTAVKALTDKSYSLAKTCEAFDTTERKSIVAGHGHITPEYIDYCRQDVRATQALYERVREEYDRHPIKLAIWKAYSSATIAKAYLRKMGVTPPPEQFASVPKKYLGFAMSAYFGGRAEARIIRHIVPVVYTDFLSMYPTVNALLGQFTLLTAASLDVRDCTRAARALLKKVAPSRLFDPAIWTALCFFAEVEPDGDVLPARAHYSAVPGSRNLGVNPVSSATPLWYAGHDLAASVLKTGKVPRIRSAFRFVPVGKQAALHPIMLRGQVRIDPRQDDFGRTLIEERRRLERRRDLSDADRARLGQFLKVMANAGGYGIFAEMNTNDRPKKAKRLALTRHGIDGPERILTRLPEHAAEFCFPPIAAWSTAGARLMLALAERCVTDVGGHYAFCDTDSIAAVATETGGIVPCEGGTLRTPDHQPGIRALSWAQVNALAARFTSLSPYDPKVVPESILKIEPENFARDRHAQRQLYAYVLGTKRYTLFNVAPDGSLDLRKVSRFGLGSVVNPAPAHGDWIETAWRYFLDRARGRSAQNPSWLDRPAVGKHTVSSFAVYERLREGRKAYADRVKPGGFMLRAHVAPFGFPAGVAPERFALIAPFEQDARKWLQRPWIDLYSGTHYRITTEQSPSARLVRVKSYRDLLREYERHVEAKSLAWDGGPCRPTTRGLLIPRPLVATRHLYIRKESNRADDEQHGLTEEAAPGTSLRKPNARALAQLRERMQAVSATMLADAAGITTRQVKRIRNGQSMPKPATWIAIERALMHFESACDTATAGPARAADGQTSRATGADRARRPRRGPTRANR
jgi:hypothetical protein